MTETQRNPLAKNFSTVSLIKFAFPSMVMMLFMGLYTIVDTVFSARFVNTNALSPVNIVCPVINLIVGVAAITVIIYSPFILVSLWEWLLL